MEAFLKSQTAFMQNQRHMLNNHTQAISRLEVQMSQLASSLSERPKDTLPSQPLANPKNSGQAYEVQDSQISQCNVTYTLRLRKKMDNEVSRPTSPVQINPTPASTSASSSQSAPQTSEKDTSADHVHKPITPFPNRLRNNNKNVHMEKILEMFNQVKLNVPLLDVTSPILC